MGVFHFLNVKEGDCNIIQHPSGHVSVFDVCNGHLDNLDTGTKEYSYALKSLGVSGNFNQKKYPENPIEYLQERNINSVFRFILTHPDMDHMDGIEDFFDTFSPTNFWDTDNTCEKDFTEGSPFKESDWKFYKNLRDTDPSTSPKRLTLYAGSRGIYFNETEDGKSGGDGLHILSPTEELVANANNNEDWNDASYVVLYHSAAGRILISGDSHDNTWEHILENHEDDVKDVDLLVAPHHGRDSGRSYDFLDVVNPKLTLFGNARSEHLAYDRWNNRNLQYITNNQAGTVIVNTSGQGMEIYATCEGFAKAYNSASFFSDEFKGWYVLSL